MQVILGICVFCCVCVCVCIYIYIYMCVCVCVCVRVRARARMNVCMCDIPVLYGISVLNRNSSYMCWCFGTGSEHVILLHRKWLWSWNQRELDIHSYCMKANCTRFYMVVSEFHISGRIFVIYLVIVPSLLVCFEYWLWDYYYLYMYTLKVFLIVEINVAWEMIRYFVRHGMIGCFFVAFKLQSIICNITLTCSPWLKFYAYINLFSKEVMWRCSSFRTACKCNSYFWIINISRLHINTVFL